MFGEENADQILEQHREQVEEQTKKTTLFSHAGKFIPTTVSLFPRSKFIHTLVILFPWSFF